MAPKPTLKTSSKSKTFSTKAHNGSSKGSRSPAPHKNTHSSHHHVSQPTEKAVDRFMGDERDHRSYVVKEYDAHQKEAKQKHQEGLVDVVRKRYV
jgi:hypothetical protein